MKRKGFPRRWQKPVPVSYTHLAWLTEGSGRITINRRGFEEYLPTVQLQNAVLQPFQVTNTMIKFDVNVVTTGGGIHGQALPATELITSSRLTKFLSARPVSYTHLDVYKRQ